MRKIHTNDKLGQFFFIKHCRVYKMVQILVKDDIVFETLSLYRVYFQTVAFV